MSSPAASLEPSTRVLIGTVVLLQVQTASLKQGEKPRRWYDPGGIRTVPSLRLDEGGVTGLDPDLVPDVHHRDHPHSKNRGDNGISIGFTGHYAAMRERYSHLTDGIAGENILVEAHGVFRPGDLGPDVVIETAGGEIHLRDVAWAPPCVEFSKFCNGYNVDQRADKVITETIQFLSDGMRGYYATFDATGSTGIVIAPGDRVYRLATS